MKKNHVILTCLVTTLMLTPAFGWASFKIASNNLYVNGADVAYQSIKPGDTLYFAAGNKNYLLIKNFRGAPGNPIVMINSGGPIVIDTDWYYGISIQNCQYIKFTGTGDPTQTYGFQVNRVANGAGLGIGYLSSDFEVDHISIQNTLIGGIYAKTDPDCTLASVRGTFTQYNTIIHDNYIAHSGNEGLYIGSTHYSGQTVACNGKDTVLMPSLLDGVQVYNNIVKYSGWDGIQVSSATRNCKIYNNTVLYDSQAGVYAQMTGIILGGGTRADCFNNFIAEGNGDGIECHGLGGCRIYNNIVLDAGRNFAPTDSTIRKYGLYVTDISVEPDSSFYIQNNNIINPKSEGIRFVSVVSKNNLIASNVIINPGAFNYYQNGNTHFKGVDSYIMFPNPGTSVTLQNNYFARNADSVKFVSSTFHSSRDFKLLAGSPLIDHAIVDPHISFDIEGSSRPYGVKSDIGAIEYEGDSTALAYPIIQNITGGGAYCTGGIGPRIGLSSSQLGVKYQLTIGGVNTGNPLCGTGSAISFGPQTSTGTYTVTGIDTTTTRSIAMNGSVSISVNALPAIPDLIGGNTSICKGYTTLLTEGTASGVWSTSAPSIATVGTGGVVAGISGGIASIRYIVTNSSGCANSVSTTVTVNTTPTQPGSFTIFSAKVSLGQSNVPYTVPLVSGVAYKWSYSGTGATITGTSNSVLLSFSSTATSGTLSVTASNGCGTSAARTIAINGLKSLTIPSDTTATEVASTNVSQAASVELASSVSELKVYPNPNKGLANFDFQIDRKANVKLEIFSIAGKFIARIFEANVEAGMSQTVLYEHSLPTGAYYCVMRWKEKMMTSKLIVLK